MGQKTTSFLLSNLHCPSCVSHIQETLLELIPRPSSVSPSLVSSWVTVEHDASLAVQDIIRALEDAGFIVCDITPDHVRRHRFNLRDGENGYLDQLLDNIRSDGKSSPNAEQPARHFEHCKACRLEGQGHKIETGSEKGHFKDKDEPPMLVGDSTSSPSPLVVVDSQGHGTLWRASLAIGGMTCASCVGTVTEELERKEWVRNVVVNLISNSATVEFVGEEHKDDIVNCIEEIGYDAGLDSISKVNNLEIQSPASLKERTVEILVDGMFCDHCPERVLDALGIYTGRLKVEKDLNIRDPILKLTYTPQAPEFTIRSILSTISDVDQLLTPTIYHAPTLEERSHRMHQREQLRLLIRVALTLIIAVPTLIIGIVYMSLVPTHNPGRMFLMHPLRAGVSRAQWALFIMATPIYFLCADVFHLRALKEIRSMWRRNSKVPLFQRFYRFGSMNMLMSLGTSIAYISSVAQLIAAGVSPASETDSSTFYFDSVVFLTLFLLIGRLIEAYSKSKTGDAVSMLGKLRPTEALLVTGRESSSQESSTQNQDPNRELDGTVQRVSVDLLDFGDVVKVLHGGSPPCDGTIVKGETKFDESSLTGESRLVKKVAGDEVFTGTVNKESPVSIQITGVAGSSMLDQIVKAVREGQTRRAPMERIADTLTSYFVPVVTLIAILTWVVWLALGTSGRLPKSYIGNTSGGWVAWSLQFAIAVFVVACPCGLALAAPTALFVGGGLAAKYGILAKGGGEAFEKASKLDCIVFDKTGTLTVGGEPAVTNFEMIGAHNTGHEGEDKGKADLLGMVKALEECSSHTIAKATVTYCKIADAHNFIADEIEEIPGRGMKGKFVIKDKETAVEIIVGNEELLTDFDTHIPQHARNRLTEWQGEGKSVALVAMRKTSTADGSTDSAVSELWKLSAYFAISDPIRPEAPGIIRALQKRGTDVWMLSGDNQITANAIGLQVGIPPSNIIAGVLPGQKAEKIQYLQKTLKSRSSSGNEHTQKRAMIGMVGDGINDSPALTTADVGIAIGSGSDIAISSAEFVLVSSNLNSLLILLDLSKMVFRRIKFNFGWALVYNLTALPVAAGVLYPIVENGSHIRLDPVWASLAMAASSISVVCSSLALRSRIPGLGFRARDEWKVDHV